jgi:glucose/arabinose dehydrogenase/cytochrome c5
MPDDTHASLTVLLLAALALSLAPRSTFAQETGAQLYDEYCARCHGDDLAGTGNGSSLIDDTWKYGSSRSEIIQITKEGAPQMGMPAFEDGLSDEQIGRITDFIREVGEDGKAALHSDAPAPPDSLKTLDHKLDAEVFAHGLRIPWAIDFIDETTALITERPGEVRVVEDGRMRPDAVSGTPGVLHQGQGGLMDVAVDPDYDDNGWIYLSYSHNLPRDGERDPAMTRIVRGRIEDNAWTDQQVVFEAAHEKYRRTRHHYGSRIVFDPEGYLYFSIGDRGAGKQAQDLSRPNGKIHRVHRDGSIPDDNPFAGREDALPSIFTYGHRNPQGMAVHPQTGDIWEVEHGPRGGDELNRLVAGRNYGWPKITYGINYNGTVMTEDRRLPGLQQPVLYWRPSIAVSGLAFYRGDRFPYWSENHLLVGALKYQEVKLLNLADGRVMHQEAILNGEGRVREAVPGPDGAVYVVLNKPGQVLRLTPEEQRYVE